MIEPIKPNEAAALKKTVFPDFVIQAFNNMIVKNLNGKYSTILQKDIISEIKRVSKIKLTNDQIFDNHYLDVEDMYRDAGWKVEYDKPAYCETYEPIFIFTKKE